jgi:hypothetical protein
MYLNMKVDIEMQEKLFPRKVKGIKMKSRYGFEILLKGLL